MFCNKCGKEIKEGAKFCGNCGAPVKANNEGAYPDVKEKKDYNKKVDKNKGVIARKTPTKKSNKKFVIIGLLLLLIIAGCAIFCVVKVKGNIIMAHKDSNSGVQMEDTYLELETFEEPKNEVEKVEDAEKDKEGAEDKEETEDKKESEEETDTEEEVIPGSSKTNAYLLPLNTKVFGSVVKNQYSWFSFKTTEDANELYYVTFVNESKDSHGLKGTVYDELGNEVEYYCNAGSDGAPVTISSDRLEVNKTYYIQVTPDVFSSERQKIDYSVIIKKDNDVSSAYKTIGNIHEALGITASDGDAIIAQTNSNDSIEIPIGATVHGTIKNAYAWFSFTTGDNEGATYNVTIVNDTPKTEALRYACYDEFGNKIMGTSRVMSDGTPVTETSTKLTPNTKYYVSVCTTGTDEKVDYSVMISSPDANKPEIASTQVFETPFEINDTQVQFVAESAQFVDEVQAKEVLKPVSEAILEHPNSKILIAGTTATDGSQVARVELSNKRAAAVKDLLVKTFKVPESQIQTIGLGFEADPFERGTDRDANGNFIESEGRKNRRVVILDVENPIAQQILKQ